MRINPITGEMEEEDDVLPGATAVQPTDSGDPRRSDAAFKATGKALRPGEWVAGGSRDGLPVGPMLTNSPSASAIMAPAVKAQQDALAAQGKAQADAIRFQTAGGTTDQKLNETAKQLKKDVIPPKAPGEAEPYKAPSSQDQVANQALLSIPFSSSSKRQVADLSDPRNAVARQTLQRRDPGALTKFTKERAELVADIEQLKNDSKNQFTSEQDWIDHVSKSGKVRPSYMDLAKKLAKEIKPDSVRAYEADDLEMQRKENVLGREIEMGKQKARAAVDMEVEAYKTFSTEAKKAEAGDVLEWASTKSDMAPILSNEKDKEAFKNYFITRDASGLTPEVKGLYDKRIADYNAETPTTYKVTTKGFTKEDIPADVRAARQLERKMAAKRGVFGVVESGEASSTINSKDPSVAPIAEDAKTKFMDVANAIGLAPRYASAMLTLGGTTPETGYSITDKALGVKAGAAISSKVVMSTSTLAEDTEKIRKVVGDHIAAGGTITDDSLTEKLKPIVAKANSSDKDRVRWGRAANEALVQIKQEADAQYKDRKQYAMQNAKGQAIAVLLNDVEGIIGKSPLEQARMLDQELVSLIPSESGALDVKVDINTLQDKIAVASKPWIFGASMLARIEKNEKTDPNMLQIYKEVLSGFADESTYDIAARQHPQIDAVLRQKASSYAAAKTVEAEYVADKLVQRKVIPEDAKPDILGAMASGSISYSLKEKGNIDSAILFSRDRVIDGKTIQSNVQKAHDLLPAQERDQFLGFIGNEEASSIPIYSASDVTTPRGKRANILADTISGSDVSRKHFGFLNDGPGAGDALREIGTKLSKQTTQVVVKDGKQPQFPPAVFDPPLVDEANKSLVDGKVKAIYDHGFDVYKNGNQALGLKYMEAAMMTAMVDEQERIMEKSAALYKNVESGIKDLVESVRGWSTGQTSKDLKAITDVVRYVGEIKMDYTQYYPLNDSINKLIDVLSLQQKSARLAQNKEAVRDVSEKLEVANRAQFVMRSMWRQDKYQATITPEEGVIF